MVFFLRELDSTTNFFCIFCCDFSSICFVLWEAISYSFYLRVEFSLLIIQAFCLPVVDVFSNKNYNAGDENHWDTGMFPSLLFKRTLLMYSFLKGLVIIDYENDYLLLVNLVLVHTRKKERCMKWDPWHVGLRSRCILNAAVINSFSWSQIEDCFRSNE